MHGNICELTLDAYDAKLPGGPDPFVEPATKDEERVNRGGCFNHPFISCRSWDRAGQPPTIRSGILGFRLALSTSHPVTGAGNRSSGAGSGGTQGGDAPASGGRQPSESLTRNAAGDSRDITLPGGRMMTLIWCPPGQFTMGTPGAKDEEAPVAVTLTNGFWIARTETTQAQWTALMKTSPWLEHGRTGRYKTGSNFPAVYIDHMEAEAFCDKLVATLGQSAGVEFALPTEAQWEYACRAGTTTAYSFGDDESKLSDYAWFGENSSELYDHEVGTKKPNPWGLYDMHGNTAEWCDDVYDAKLLGGPDPTGPSAGLFRVLRGGTAGNLASYFRSARRDYHDPANRYGFGFRVVAK